LKFVHLVALLAIIQFIFFAIQVGRARGQYGVKAPANSGHEQFDRMYRVQTNTLEQLICLLPSLLIAAIYWPPVYIAGVGVLYLIGRMLYWQSYIKDPGSRGTGFMITFASTSILILAAMVGLLFRQAA